MAVPQAEDAAVVVAIAAADDLHQTEVALPVMGEAVGLGADGEVGALQGALDGLNELVMWDGVPGVRWLGRGDVGD